MTPFLLPLVFLLLTKLSSASSYKDDLIGDLFGPEKRKVSQADLAGFNNLIANFVLSVPTIALPTSAAFSGSITNFQCKNIQLNALTITSSRTNNQVAVINLNVGIQSVTCTAGLTYKVLSVFSGSTSFEVDLQTTTLNTALSFTSTPDYLSAPPSSLAVTSCSMTLNVQNLAITGGGVGSSILSALINSLTGVLNSVLPGVACSQFGTLASGTLSTYLGSLQTLLAPYVGTPPPPLSNSATETFLSSLGTPTDPVMTLNGPITSMAANIVNNVFGGPSVPCTGQSSQPISLNGIMASLGDAQGWLVIPLGVQINSVDIISTSNITLESISIHGLDSISKFSVINPVANTKYTMTHTIAFSQLKFIIPMKIILNPGLYDSTSQIGQISQSIIVNMELDSLEIDVTTAIGVDVGGMLGVVIENLVSSPIACLSRALKGLVLNDFKISLGKIVGPTVSNFICPGIDAFLNSAVQAVFTLVEGFVLNKLPNISESIRGTLNTEIATLVSTPNACPAHPEPLTDSDFLSFHNPNLTLALNLVSNIINSGCGSMLNNIIGTALTDLNIADKTGKISIANGGSLLNLNLNTQIGPVIVDISNLFIENVNVLSNVNLLTTATDQYAFGNSMEFGASAPYLTVSVDIFMNLDEAINDNFTLSLQVGQISMSGDLMMKLNTDIAMPFTIGDMLYPGCLVSMVNNYGIENGHLNIGVISPNIVCKKCLSPLFPQISQYMTSKGGEAEIISLMNVVLTFVYDIFPPIKVMLDGFMGNYGGSCPGNNRINQVVGTFKEPTPLPTVTPEGLVIVGYMLGFYCFCILCIVLYRTAARRKFLREKEMLQDQGDIVDDELNTFPLSQDANTPNCYKIALPIMFICGITIFITAHSFVGATVDLKLSVGGDTLVANNLFTFSLNNSIHDMLASGAWPLAMLIAVFSGAWPYIKILSMAFCFYSVGYVVSPNWRGRILFVLDVMGKWSLLDVFVLVMMMAAFNMHIAPPSDTAFLPPGFVVANVAVDPNWGIFGFVIAATFSIIANFLIVRLHRISTSLGRVKLIAEDGDEKRQAEKISVADFVLSDSYGYIQYTKLGKYCITGLLLASMFSLIIGAFTPSFQFTFQGAIAVLLDWSSTSLKTYSLYSIAANLTGQAGPGLLSWVGIIFLQFTFLMVSFIIPVARFLVMLILWLVPMTVHHQHNMQEASEFFHSWSCLEVFLLSVIAAMFEVMQIAGFMLGGACDQANLLLQQTAVASGTIPAAQGTCFFVQTNLTSSILFLFFASIIGTIVGRVVTDSTERVLNERLKYAIEIEDEYGAGNKNFSFKFLQWVRLLRVDKTLATASAFQRNRRATYQMEVKRRRTRSRAYSAALELEVERRKSVASDRLSVSTGEAKKVNFASTEMAVKKKLPPPPLPVTSHFPKSPLKSERIMKVDRMNPLSEK